MKFQKKDHIQQFPFEMANQLTINFFHRHYTNFDRDKLFPEKSSIILFITNQKFLMSKVSKGYLKL